MKKLWILILVILSIGLYACDKDEAPNEVNIYLPDGTPALAMANLLDEGFDYEGTKTNVHIVAASEIAARVSQESCDIAIMPTTAAAQLFHRGIELQLASVNVFGNLYITGTKETSSLEDLKGKVVLTTAATTIQMVKYILDGVNVPYEESGSPVEGKVALSSTSDASEIIPRLKQAMTKEEELYGVLGEPQVTKAQGAISGLKINFDLQQEYKSLTGFDGYPQACLVVKNALSAKYPKYMEALLSKLTNNEAYLSANLEKLPKVFEAYESNLANMSFTADTIQRCNLRIVLSRDVMDSVKQYVKELAKIDLTDAFFL
ncbi:MAG TPA: hypothetical protein PKV66_01345 [Candidatus Pelethenecus sp.]|nr:hypothetical protein [Candidatus Pelethenecus sp.]